MPVDIFNCAFPVMRLAGSAMWSPDTRPWPSCNALVLLPGCHALLGKFRDRLRRLLEMGQPHALQDMIRLGELDVRVGRELNPVAPRIEEIREAAIKKFNSHPLQTFDGKGLVVDGNAEMTSLVRPLAPAGREVDELVAKVDKGSRIAPGRNLEIQEPRIEVQRRLDVADFDCNMVDTDLLYGSCLPSGSWVHDIPSPVRRPGREPEHDQV